MMQIEHNSFAPHNDTNVHFIPSLFNDTLRLLFEAHNYFEFEGQEHQAFLPEAQQLVFANEMSRVTMRLTSVMAWLMIRKANHEGSLEQEEEELINYRLEAQDICLVQNPVHHANLPDYLVGLLDDSYNLYNRVRRLDEAEQAAPAWMVHATSAPALSLQ